MRRLQVILKIFKKLIPIIIVILVWVLPVPIKIQIAITVLVGFDLYRTYCPDKIEFQGDDDE